MSHNNFFEQHLQIHTIRIELKTGRVLIYRIDGRRKAELEEWMRSSSDPELVSFISPFLSFYSDYDRMTFVRVAAIKRVIFMWDPVYGFEDADTYSDPFDLVKGVDKTIEASPTDVADFADWLRETNEEQAQLQTGKSEEDVVVEEPGDKVDDSDTEEDPFAMVDRTVDGSDTEMPEGLDIPDAIVLCAAAEPFIFYELDEEVDYIPIDAEEGLNNLSIEGRFIAFNDADDERNYFPLENVICIDVARKLVFKDALWAVMERRRSIDNNPN